MRRRLLKSDSNLELNSKSSLTTTDAKSDPQKYMYYESYVDLGAL